MIIEELFFIFTKLSLMHKDIKISDISLCDKRKKEVYHSLINERGIYRIILCQSLPQMTNILLN